MKRAAVDLIKFFKVEFAEHTDVTRRTEAALSDAFAKLVQACATSIRGGGKLMFFGNGGSAADAQHLATELTIRYKKDRAAIAAVALTTDSSALTAAGNDLGFEKIFARQIEALGRKGDVAVAISTSGKSANVIAGLKQAKAMGLVTAALGGNDGGAMVMAATAALRTNPFADREEIKERLGGNICRCTGYQKIFDAVELARDVQNGRLPANALLEDEAKEGDFIGKNVRRVDTPSKVSGRLKYAGDMGQSYVLHTPEGLRDALRRGSLCVNHPYRAGPFYLLLPLNTQPATVTVNLAALPARPQPPKLAPADDAAIGEAANMSDT